MNPVSTELWRKPESVSIDKFPVSCHASIRKGLQVLKGEIADDSGEFYYTNESKGEEGTKFTEEEMNILREKLGVELIHGNHSLNDLKEIIRQEIETKGHSFKKPKGRS
jgi:hypothetical protein